MRKKLLLVALGGALACSVAGVAGCRSCGTPPPLAVAGIAFYAASLIVALARPDAASLRFALMAASGFHLGLIAAMASRGFACGSCLGAASCAFMALALVLGRDMSRWNWLPPILPWTAAAGLLMAPPSPPVDSPPHTRIVAYTRPDCPYCDELRDRVLPEATRGLAVEVVFRDAAGADFVTRTPTLLISRGANFRVVEGLPAPERLREEIARVEGGRP